MATTKKVEPAPAPSSEVSVLHDEAVTVLREFLDVLETRANDVPGEHNVEPLQRARQALIALDYAF